MNLPQELVRLICSFSDSPTLASICLSNKAFCLDASAILYADLCFPSAQSVERFLLCARGRLNSVKHLSISIPAFPDPDVQKWKSFLAAVGVDSNLISLKITSPPNHPIASPEVQHLAGELLSNPSLKYLAVTTSVVSTTTAIQCPALRELEIRGSDELDEKELGKYTQGERQKLNTLILGGHNGSPQLLGSLFNLNDLQRLALAYPNQILDTTCSTLKELALWVHSGPAETYLTEFRQLTFPNLQVFILLHNEGIGIDQSWETCDSLVSAVISVSGTQLREFRLYLHNCHPSKILNGEKSFIPHFHPQITVLRLYCWDSDAPPPRAGEAETILRERMSRGRDFQVAWSVNWSSLTHFGVPRELGPS
ncbi:hypothetical protein DL96DRAFT_1581682 [Flagelloscypha sp. PMI_526]|nr:hypothetical protein DL96DRAFT_1581682 [Flagelloscypha sp. PMI_526]